MGFLQLDVTNCCKPPLYEISKKFNEPNLRKSQKNPACGPILTTLAQKFLELIPTYHCTQYQGKLMNQTWEIEKKNLFWIRFWPIRPKFGSTIFFSQKMASLVARCHGQLSSSTIPEKTNDPILRTDRRTDRWPRVISWMLSD